MKAAQFDSMVASMVASEPFRLLLVKAITIAPNSEVAATLSSLLSRVDDLPTDDPSA